MEFDLPRFEDLPPTHFIGLRSRMNHIHNTTHDLWSRFMPAHYAIENRKGTGFYDIAVYPDTSYFTVFDPSKYFEKWAAVAVDKPVGTLPEGMEGLDVQGGLYAVFTYRGRASEARKMFGYIFGEWMPGSEYTLDARPHLALMGPDYKREDPNSREEFWIPVQRELN